MGKRDGSGLLTLIRVNQYEASSFTQHATDPVRRAAAPLSVATVSELY